MRRTKMNMNGRSRIVSPRAGSLLRCAFACVLALSLALPAEGISAAFAADIPAAGSAAVAADGAGGDGSGPEAGAADPDGSGSGGGEEGNQGSGSDPVDGPDVAGPDASEGDDPDASVDGSEADGADPIVMEAPEDAAAPDEGAAAGDPSLLASPAATDICQIIRTNGGTETFVGFYTTLENAAKNVQEGDRIELIRDYIKRPASPTNPRMDLEISPVLDPAYPACSYTIATAPISPTVSGASGWLGAAPGSGSPQATIACALFRWISGPGKSLTLKDVSLKKVGSTTSGVKSFLYFGGGSIGPDPRPDTASASVFFENVDIGNVAIHDGNGHTPVIDLKTIKLYLNEGTRIHHCEALDSSGQYGNYGSLGIINAAYSVVTINEGAQLDHNSSAGGVICGMYLSWSGDQSYVVMNGGEITDNRANGGAALEALTELRLYGGTITGNVAEGNLANSYEAGAVSNCAKVYVQGNPVVAGNTVDNATHKNYSDLAVRNNSTIVVDGPLSPEAKVVVGSTDPGTVATYAKFGTYTGGNSSNLDIFKNGVNNSIVGSDGGSGNIVWSIPKYQIIRSGSYEGGYGTLASALAFAQGGDRVEAVTNDATFSSAATYSGTGTVMLTTAPASQPVSGAWSWQGAVPPVGESPRATITRAPSGAEVSLTGGGTLELENIAFSGGGVALFKVASSGGYLVLGDGAVLRDGSGSLFRSTVASSGFTMKDGSLITGWNYNGSGTETRCMVDAYGAISIEGGAVESVGTSGGNNYSSLFYGRTSGSSISMSGGEVKDCTAAVIINPYSSFFLSGGKVVDNFSTTNGGNVVLGDVRIQGDPVVARNLSKNPATYEQAKANIKARSVHVDGPLQASAEIHISSMPSASQMADGAQFATYDPGFGSNAGVFKNDADPSLVGFDWGGGEIRWGAPSVQIIRPNASGAEELFAFYGALDAALAAAQVGDRIELLKDIDLSGPAPCTWTSGSVELTTAPASQPVSGAQPWQGAAPAAGEAPQATVTRTAATGGTTVASGGGLRIEHVVFDGASVSAEVSLFTVEATASLTLGDGAEVKDVVGGAGSYAGGSTSRWLVAAVASVSAGSFSMESGSLVENCGPDYSLLNVSGISTGTVSSPITCASTATVHIGGGTIRDCWSFSHGGALLVTDGTDPVTHAYTPSVLSGSVTVDGDALIEGCTAGFMPDGETIIASGSSMAASGGGCIYAVFVHFELGGSAVIRNNKATSWGSAICASSCPVDISGSPQVTGNKGFRFGAGAVATMHNRDTSPITLSGNPVIKGNTIAFSPSSGASIPADLFVGDRFGSSREFLRLSVGSLGPSADVGIRVYHADMDGAGMSFATHSSSSNLNRLFNDLDPALVGADGGSGKVVWKLGLVDASFTKVGASQEPGAAHGLYAGLPGARFNVYEYVGATPLTQAALDAGAIGPATTASADWAPLLDANGTVGAAGSASNVPHGFVSDSNGKVDLTKVKPNSWYMLVETQAPTGYQLPQGQWAFKVSDPDGDGTFDIDTGNVLACKGPSGGGGSLPPAMATSVSTSSGTQTGVFVVNTPEFGLPHVGVLPQLPLALLAGAALMAAAWALHRKRMRRSRHAG